MTDDPAGKAGTEGERLFPPGDGGVLDGVLNALQDASGHLVRSNEPGSVELVLSGADLSAMRARIQEEVERHEARVLNAEGQGAAAPVDLDEIRASIGRRLDRIRDARGAG